MRNLTTALSGETAADICNSAPFHIVFYPWKR
jgi:hypothetical protein